MGRSRHSLLSAPLLPSPTLPLPGSQGSPLSAHSSSLPARPCSSPISVEPSFLGPVSVLEPRSPLPLVPFPCSPLWFLRQGTSCPPAPGLALPTFRRVYATSAAGLRREPHVGLPSPSGWLCSQDQWWPTQGHPTAPAASIPWLGPHITSRGSLGAFSLLLLRVWALLPIPTCNGPQAPPWGICAAALRGLCSPGSSGLHAVDARPCATVFGPGRVGAEIKVCFLPCHAVWSFWPGRSAHPLACSVQTWHFLGGLRVGMSPQPSSNYSAQGVCSERTKQGSLRLFRFLEKTRGSEALEEGGVASSLDRRQEREKKTGAELFCDHAPGEPEPKTEGMGPTTPSHQEVNGPLVVPCLGAPLPPPQA